MCSKYEQSIKAVKCATQLHSVQTDR